MKTTVTFKGRKLEIQLTKGNVLLSEGVILTEIGIRADNQMLSWIGWSLYALGLSMDGESVYVHNIREI